MQTRIAGRMTRRTQRCRNIRGRHGCRRR
jgi:hypothetical protein